MAILEKQMPDNKEENTVEIKTLWDEIPQNGSSLGSGSFHTGALHPPHFLLTLPRSTFTLTLQLTGPSGAL